MKSEVIVLCLFILVGASQANAVEPQTRIHCEGEKIALDIDLYATGHPMGGVGMFTGFMQVDFKNRRQKPIVFVRTGVSKTASSGFKLSGTSREPHARAYQLTVESKVNSQQPVRAQLEVGGIGPFPTDLEPFAELGCLQL